jgi:hypothetical protein
MSLVIRLTFLCALFALLSACTISEVAPLGQEIEVLTGQDSGDPATRIVIMINEPPRSELQALLVQANPATGVPTAPQPATEPAPVPLLPLVEPAPNALIPLPNDAPALAAASTEGEVLNPLIPITDAPIGPPAPLTGVAERQPAALIAAMERRPAPLIPIDAP